MGRDPRRAEWIGLLILGQRPDRMDGIRCSVYQLLFFTCNHQPSIGRILEVTNDAEAGVLSLPFAPEYLGGGCSTVG